MYYFYDNQVMLRYIDVKALYNILMYSQNPLMNAQTLGPSQ